MGNLGDYQKITTIAKCVGGPRNLLGIIVSSSLLAGSLITVGIGSIVYLIKKKTNEKDMPKIEVKKTISSENEAKKFKTLLETN